MDSTELKGLRTVVFDNHMHHNLVYTKAMRLPEIFDFRTIPDSRKSKNFDGRKFSENLPDFPGIKFHENVQECTRNVPVFLINVKNVP